MTSRASPLNSQYDLNQTEIDLGFTNFQYIGIGHIQQILHIPLRSLINEMPKFSGRQPIKKVVSLKRQSFTSMLCHVDVFLLKNISAQARCGGNLFQIPSMNPNTKK